jgi:NAD(P)-dependent dehydrogenase (short-subunit alcohol dehydrogenase family)
MARDWPYPGSTTITMANGAVTSMVRTLAVELAPVRVNAIHPGAVGDSPAVSEMPPALIEATRARTPTGRLATMDDVAAAALSLLDNPGINGVNLPVDGGFLLKEVSTVACYPKWLTLIPRRARRWPRRISPPPSALGPTTVSTTVPC